MKFTYSWEWAGETQEEMTAEELLARGRETVLAKAKDIAYTVANADFPALMNKEGIGVVINKIDVDSGFYVRTVQYTPTNITPYYRLWMTAKVEFYCDKDLMNSPLDPVTATILIKLVAIMVAALVAYFSLKAFFESTLTTHSVITKITTNPDGSVTETIEELTSPSSTGILSVGIVLGVVIFLAVMLMRER